MNIDRSAKADKHKKVYRDGNSLIKLFDECYHKSDILNEALNQSRVEETGLNIPKLTGVVKIDGKWAIVMDFIEGETLESLMRAHPDKLDGYMDLFISIHREIHAKRSPLLTKYKDKMTSKILKSELNASTRYDLSLRLDAMPNHTHVCHGDFNPSNIIIGKDGKAYIIDWSHASQGNATADVAKSYIIFRVNGENEWAETYLNRYCETVGTDRKYVEEWLPIVASAQLIKVSDPERKAQLMRFVDGEEI